MGTLIMIIVVLIIVGVLLYLVNTIIPMPHWIKTVINALAGIFVLLWILNLFHLIPGFDFNPTIRH